MSTDGILKGAVAGAGAALLVMYIAKYKRAGCIGGSQGTAISGALKNMSNERLEELKDSIDDIIAEREAE